MTSANSDSSALYIYMQVMLTTLVKLGVGIVQLFFTLSLIDGLELQTIKSMEPIVYFPL